MPTTTIQKRQGCRTQTWHLIQSNEGKMLAEDLVEIEKEKRSGS